MTLKKVRIMDIVFYLAIGIYFFFTAMTITMVEQVEILATLAKVMRYVCYIAFVFFIMYNAVGYKKRISIKEIIINGVDYAFSHLLLIAVLFVAGVIYLEMGERIPLILVLVIWACSFYDFKKIVKVFLGTALVLMTVTWMLSILKVIPEVINVREGKYRYALGFCYPLETMAFFLFLVICYIYIQGKKFSVKDWIMINIINLLLYSITASRTSVILTAFISFVAVVYAKVNMEKIMRKLFPWLGYGVLLTCTAVSIVGGMMYDPKNELLSKINTIISNRLRLTNDAFDEYGLTLFGQKIEWVGYGGLMDIKETVGKYNFVDCSYAKVLLDFGLVFLVLVLIGYAVAYYNASKKQEYALMIAITVVLVVSIMEPRLISLEMNPFVLLLGNFFLAKNKPIFKLKHETNS